MTDKQVHVAVGVIERNGHIFLTRRAAHQHQGNKWEFPGGKCEPGETVAQALARELSEELAITVHDCSPLLVVCHDYGDKQVKLDVHWVRDFDGEPQSQEGLEGRWVLASVLPDYDFPAANVAIVEQVVAQLLAD
ncbi:7,8-dihydro-8-oxoguanine-triphosphatase [Neiella marina]|uniref:8-oxo-dGTP diphosphatase n=1 Tax=Neiella marina TaxID=508461 RepID=A0A8J2U4E8_9GAMM|nr:8-oxo-dGTP diphosphatase MutT [Neiella marina]GGA74506.1 7,8-dihydro-8-oxoguanine-triphosphatase [Neiella marina]